MPARPSQTADPETARAVAVEIVRTLRANGHVAYLAGGCVRDELLGLHPTDYDIATDATPHRISALFPRTAEVGASFGVVLVTLGRVTVEVATFRSDGPYSDRRRPDTVHFSTPQADAQRRDFTINALFLDPLEIAPGTKPGGRLIDYVGGEADLRARVLRAVGEPSHRFAEDHLRALRAVRFAARLDFSIDPPTALAIRAHARDLTGVSRERIGDELRRMLQHPSRARALELLTDLTLDGPVLNEDHRPATPTRIAALSGTGEPVALSTTLAAWSLDRGLRPHPRPPRQGRQGPLSPTAALVARWRDALCLSNDESGALADILNTLGSLVFEWGTLGVAARKRLASRPEFGESLKLLTIEDPPNSELVRISVAELAATPSGLCPKPLLDGDQLRAAGFVPSPRFKDILDRVYDAQLEGRVGTTDQALAYGVRLAQEPPPTDRV